MMPSVCWHTVHTSTILIPSAWLDRSCWWRSRLEFSLGGGRIRHFSTFLSIALAHAGIEIHGGGCYRIIGWAEEYVRVGQDGSKTLTRMWQKFHYSEMEANWWIHIFVHTCPHLSRLANGVSRESYFCPVSNKRSTLVHSILWWGNRRLNMAILPPKSIEIWLFILSCAEIQPVGLLSSIPLVHLLVRVRCLGQLSALWWTR